jgi:hypothetical protein
MEIVHVPFLLGGFRRIILTEIDARLIFVFQSSYSRPGFVREFVALLSGCQGYRWL